MVSRPLLENLLSRLILVSVVLMILFSPGLAPSAWPQSHDDHAGDEGGENGEHADEGEGHEGEGHDGPILLDQKDIERMGIELAPAGPGVIRTTLTLPGEIALNQDRVADIVPRFNGIVREVRKHLGDDVRAGEVMAVIESNTSLQTYEVKSLIAGSVVEKHITLGEFVSTESDVYIVADLSDVWVDIAVYARDQGAVSVGQEVEVRSNDLNISAKGVISYLSPLVDEQTRTSLARTVLPNSKGLWRPGSFITAEILAGVVTVPVAVPNHAIETMEDHDVVFVQTDRGFTPRQVTVGLANGGKTEIVAGLQAGEMIVVEGSFTLKAELMKESFGEGHGH